MKPNMPRRATQRGFSLLTGFILAIIMFGTLAFFLAGQGINAGFGATYSNTSKVSGMLVSAGYVNTGFDAVTLSGQTAAQVTFDSAANTGIFNPTSGGAAAQVLDPTLFTDVSTQATALAPATGTHGYWIYRKNDIKLNQVGTAALSEYTMLASGLKVGVCQQINATLLGYALNAAVPSLGVLESAVVSPPIAGINNNTSPTLGLDLQTSGAGLVGRMNACYGTTDATPVYVYIHTLLAQ